MDNFCGCPSDLRSKGVRVSAAWLDWFTFVVKVNQSSQAGDTRTPLLRCEGTLKVYFICGGWFIITFDNPYKIIKMNQNN